MVFAADFPFLDVLWSMIIFFAWVAWIWMMIVILSDVFRRDDIGGWKKAAWCVFMIVLPFIGVLTYLIAQHDGMVRRNMEQADRVQRQFDERVRTVAGSGNGGSGGGAAAQIEAAERLRARGTINDDEFASLKAKALAS
ncbi:SHOCT domain-containing protein [Conexibacter stalactiti]|uniref:SHOCT domain-containing protein n=1 Tax=Conexibacter stalactiti TaxID=1940611 RepID=A0ABU4HKF2_9ACTN|nr:SHOCT domain-containing protein [Conexibacter stalactiti]MDW5593189.1 SHOCT domain-containing protein [Conexibacter stalactiti]MEC5033830.1 SHOCT domain-containing protein [Conexibacter stalactiti]